MAILTIHRGNQQVQLAFEAPRPLGGLLAEAGLTVEHPCGGRGVCGKCAVVLSGSVSQPTEAETRCQTRLSCQAVIQGDAEVILPVEQNLTQIAGGSAATLEPKAPMPGPYGAAIDIGTTTLALSLYDLATGRCLSGAGMRNPQTAVAADVIGRMQAAMEGQADLLQNQMAHAVQALIRSACARAALPAEQVSSLTVTGNTTMLYLLNGFHPEKLSHAPFEADHYFGCQAEYLGRTTYYPPCLHAFVGADTSCAMLASGLLDRDETALLCDVGTNGELALKHNGRLYIASTAAGPAFEGAGISCGCSSVPGAICQAEKVNGQLICRTLEDQPAVGLCGSGLVDVIAALLDMEVLDETGLMEEPEIPLQDGIKLTQGDIRAVQLAKAAIHAGIQALLAAAQCKTENVKTVYIAGGFGSHLNLKNAARIGLFPAELVDRMQCIGNGALDGAALLLLDTTLRQKLTAAQALAEHVRLDGNPLFAQSYIDAMLFE